MVANTVANDYMPAHCLLCAPQTWLVFVLARSSLASRGMPRSGMPRSGMPRSGMPRRMWIAVVIVVGTGATGLLFSQPHASDANMPLTVVPAVPAQQDVRVRHEYITLMSPPPVYSPRLSSPTLSASAATAAPPEATNRPRRSRPTERALLSKVGRAVAGDGRYRPEPFPRLR